VASANESPIRFADGLYACEGGCGSFVPEAGFCQDCSDLELETLAEELAAECRTDGCQHDLDDAELDFHLDSLAPSPEVADG
jgi:hypothetical protein